MQSIELLVQRFLDDRDDLADDELDALVDAAGGDPPLAARLKDQLLIDELLAQQLAVDRRNFPAQVRQRLRDAAAPPPSVAPLAAAETGDEALAQDLRKLADVDYASRQQQSHRQRLRSALWLAACAILLAGAAGAWWWQQSRASLAVVQAAAGEPSIVAQGQPLAAQVGAALRPGDRLVTRPGETLAVKFTDGSLLELHGDTSLLLRGGRGSAAKDLLVEWGSLAAEVRPQPAGALMQLETPLAVATVRGTRLRLAADSGRTRLDVYEGVVQLVRKADRAHVDVQSREFAIATASELAVKPLAWPLDRRDVIVLLETGDPATPALVRHTATRELRPVKLQAHGRARMNHDFAWVLTGGGYAVSDAGRALRTACRATGELTIEATITPAHLDQRGPAQIIACARDGERCNFGVAQAQNRLVLRLLTDDDGRAIVDLELCRIAAGVPQHVAIGYRPGELVCYIDGRRVYQDASVQGRLTDWQPYELLLGSDAAERSWAGTLEGVAIYDRFLDEQEIAGNAELYRAQRALRAAVPQVHFAGTLVARSTAPTTESIAPQRAALVVSRYRVDEVYRGDLPDAEVLVAEWAVLDAEPQPPAALRIGRQRRLTIERLGLNPQLAGIPRSDAFHQDGDPEKPRYYDVSTP